MPVDFQRIFEHSKDSYVLLAPDAPDFTILAASDGYVRSAQQSREDLVGNSLFAAFPENPDAPGATTGPATLRSALEQVLRDKQETSVGTLRYDIPDPVTPGHFAERYFSPRNIPILDDAGAVEYILHRVDEVTDFVLRERFRPQDAGPKPDSAKEILVIESDPGRRAFLEGLFATQYQVRTGATAEEAVAAVEDHLPDLLYTAMDLPDQGAEALVRTLRDRPETSELPVIVALGKTSPQQFQAAFAAGASEVVTGHVTAREVLARTEAKLAEIELRQSLPARARERYHQLFMQAPVAITFLEGPDHVFTVANAAHEELVGHRDLVGLPVRKAFPEQNLQPVFDQLDRVYATGEPYIASEIPVDFQLPGPEGLTRKYVTFSYLPLRNLDGSILGVASFAYEVTEAVEARQAQARESARQAAVARLGERALWNPPLQLLFDQATRELAEQLEVDFTKVLEWHPDEGTLLLRSGTGWPQGQVGTATEPDQYGSPGGYTLLTEEPVFIADLTTEERFAASELLTEHGAVSGVTVVIRGAQQPYGVLAAFTKAPRTFTGDEVNFLQALANVLAASIQRADTEARLRHSEAQFRNMADGLPVPIWMNNASGEQELVNQTMCEYFGVTREEMVGNRWQDFLHPEDAEAYIQEATRCFEEQRPFHAETRAKRADGQWRLLESWGEPRFSPTGECQGMVGASLDITEQREAEEQLREADRRKKEFLALLGHELRNPLTPIANVAQLLQLQKGTIDRARLSQMAEVLTRQSAHLTRIVNDLLDLSRLERDQITLERESVDLRELVSQAVESIPALRDREGHTLAVAFPEDPLIVEGDRVRITQMLTNLLDNAAKHTPEDAEIRVEATLDEGQVIVRVCDQGAGIDPAFLPHLFEPFERGPDEGTQFMGLGLGLPLVKRLVALHGGTVEGQSPGIGQGSTFVIRLPAQASAGTEEQEEADAVGVTGAGSILLVEDHEDVAGSLRFLLEGLNQEVRLAPSGTAGIEAATEHRPALVFIDIGLPDMSGFQVAEQLREVMGAIPLVALSGHPASEFTEERTELFDEWLLKPPTLKDLQQTLARRGRS
ncbi:PAS domain-containing protein [Thiohalorhabdus methylotrophus]|uniref:PAS domain-containing protein n=1 Tax=Thiohalorhabdus methylotrophus TaxID=3242694 RepID=UPI0035A17686